MRTARQQRQVGGARRRRAVAVLIALGTVTALLLTATWGAPPREVSTEGQAAIAETTGETVVPVLGAPKPLDLAASGANGRTRIEQALACDGGDGGGGYWHLQGEDALPPGVITGATNPLTGDVRFFADLHSPFHTIRTNPEPVASPGPVAQAAFLLPDASRVALSNARGTVKLALASGSCTRDGGFTFDFDGTQASGAGTWVLDSSAGSYRGATAQGTFSLDADVSPGADNPWALDLTGSIQVLQPDLDVELVETYWGRDGVDYLSRQVAAVYRVTNVGAGDSYATALTAASSPTPGASLVRIVINGQNLLIDGNPPVGTFPRSLGDLAAGEEELVTVVWQLPLPARRSVCGLVILGCRISTSLTFSAPDALDLPTTHSASVPVRAPDLPPPL